ncbi:MAG: hypothetical protein KME20_11525 [Kaiparowitsia implicata GSE-PSE-MK54-09C]|jgi:hypothetical protein|nr:hypothetical protein [Kaiparowitsia implicata GSE-PSE-MK54-09C]
MSQDANLSPTPTNSEPSFGAIEPATLTIEREQAVASASQQFADDAAHQLMDELFGDVEQVLGVDVSLPRESVDPMDLPPMSLAIAGLLPSITEPTEDETAENGLDATDAADIAALGEPESKQDNVWGRSLDQWLMALAVISIAATGLIWWVMQRQGQPSTAEVATTGETLPAGDREFLSYMERSLVVLDQKTEQRPSESDSLPNISVAAANSPTVLERVYVPIYQPPQSTAMAPVPIPAPTTLPQPQSQIAASITAPNAPAAPTPEPNTGDQTAAVIPNITPVVNHVLIGVLELGDRSAALFEINGVPQRVQMGESVGSSGWMLVSVSNDEAIVRRNGEVRSIYIGQTF